MRLRIHPPVPLLLQRIVFAAIANDLCLRALMEGFERLSQEILSKTDTVQPNTDTDLNAGGVELDGLLAAAGHQ